MHISQKPPYTGCRQSVTPEIPWLHHEPGGSTEVMDVISFLSINGLNIYRISESELGLEQITL